MKARIISILLVLALVMPIMQANRASATTQMGSQSTDELQNLTYPYDVTLLQGLDGSGAEAYEINDNGLVIGDSNDHAVLWTNDTPTDLGTLGGNSSHAADINSYGQVVGWSRYSASWESKGFIWESGAGMRLLETLGGPQSIVHGINDLGTVVGHAYFPGEAVESAAVKWIPPDPSAIDLLYGNNSTAIDINGNGHIIIDFWAGSCCQNASIDRDGEVTSLGSLGGSITRASAINNAGQVVGGSTDSYGSSHAFLWQSNKIQDIHPDYDASSTMAEDINEKGTIVGWHSGGGAVKWEDGIMVKLQDLIDPASGWTLAHAYGINNAGEIVGWGYKTPLAGHQAFKLTPSKKKPVLVVPGIAGTYAADVDDDLTWLMNRGVLPFELQIDPIGNTYHDLIQTLKNVGYIEGKDLFVVNYDWRLPLGPVDNQFDGLISGLDAASLSDLQFDYGIDYLGLSLRLAAEAYRNSYGIELDKVNVIAHSTGGILTRVYIQSDAYGRVYDPGMNYKLPEIAQFIMVGVPNRGASKAWNPLHDNWVSSNEYKLFLSKILNRAYQKVLDDQTIHGPDYDITKASITSGGVISPTLFIDQYVPSLRSLLPTYPFYWNGAQYIHLNDDPASRNALLLDLNNGYDLVAGAVDPNLFANKTNSSVFCEGRYSTIARLVPYQGASAPRAIHHFTDFFPQAATPADTWYLDQAFTGGDGTVPLESCRDHLMADPRIQYQQFPSIGDTSHPALISNQMVQSYILDILHIEHSVNAISSGHSADWSNAISVILDPVEGFLVDGAGNRLGYSQDTGAVTEIPNSRWFGALDGFGFISGNVDMPLSLQLTGLGQDHYVMVSVEHHGAPVGGVISTGYLEFLESVIVPVDVTFSTFLPLVKQ